MTTYFPIVIEHEQNGAYSAYVPGLPIYAAADSKSQVERSIRKMLVTYFETHPATAPSRATVRVARVSDVEPVRILSAAALVSATTSAAKAHASRLNGLLGGRPRLMRTGLKRQRAAKTSRRRR